MPAPMRVGAMTRVGPRRWKSSCVKCGRGREVMVPVGHLDRAQTAATVLRQLGWAASTNKLEAVCPPCR